MHTKLATLALIAAAGAAAAQSAIQPAPQATPQPTLTFSAAEAAEYLDAIAPTNAALVYYQHFITTFQADALTESYVHFNADPDDDDTFSRTAEEAEQALADAQDEFANLYWASTLPHCDFGIQFQHGWEALLPHLGKLRAAARVLEADARRHLEAGDADAAARRLATIYNMSRQISHEGVLISSLVSAALNAYAQPLTGEMIESADLTEDGRDLLIASLESFDPEDPYGIRACVTMEGVVSLGWLTKRFSDGNAGTRLSQLGFFGDSPDPQLVRKLDALDGPTLRAEAEKMIEFYRRTLEVWHDDDAIAKIEALGAIVEIGGFGDLAKLFAAAFDRARAQDLKAQAQLRETLTSLRAYRPDPDNQNDEDADAPQPEATAPQPSR